MTKKTSGYAQLVGALHSPVQGSAKSSWLNELSQQLDDTLDLIQAELCGDFESVIDSPNESAESDRLQVTAFPIEEYDWQTVMAS